jgi:glycosyltransferase involved in cell wall biosynthesis
VNEPPLSLLCIEPRFPGRLGATADWLVRRRGYRCQFFCASADDRAHWPASAGHGMDVIQYKIGGVALEPAAVWHRCFERGLCYAYGCYEVLDARRPRPVDLVLGRSALLGSTLFAPVTLPGTPVVNLFDYYLAPHQHDLADELPPETPAEYFHWRRAAGAMDLLELENGAAAWTPTRWQRDLFPPGYHADFTVQHDGVDTTRFRPRRSRGRRVVLGRAIPDDTLLVTFVARSLDQLRGFDRFVELADRRLTMHRDVLFIAAGERQVRHTLDVANHGQDYATAFLVRHPLREPDRLWLPGFIPPDAVADLLAASDLHVYPSRPYPVARSLLQALASGCVTLVWDTAPIREVVQSDRTALLVGDMETAFRRARDVLDDPAAFVPLGDAAAAAMCEQLAQDVCVPRLAEWFTRLVETSR